VIELPIVDIDWLKEHVEVPQDFTIDDVAAALVKVGLEEETINRATVTGNIVVGYVVDAVPEPQKNGKIINWCQVDVGERFNATDENGNKVPRGIVCGAPNMAKDEKVVVALDGSVLPGDFHIEPRKTYGHISNGMCCSERELGLGDNYDGIILLRDYGFTKAEYDALKPGDDAVHLLHLDQPTLEINITPDRGYAFSYRGVCREFHHSTGGAFVDPVPQLLEKAKEQTAAPAHDQDGQDAGDEKVAVVIDDQAPIHGVVGCDRYYVRAVHGCNPASRTPNWLRRRLIRAGMRSISLAVDVTNYIMLDLGQPLHAYDLDKVVPPIVVRRALAGEKLTTLDKKERELDPEDLIITDSPDGKQGSRILGIAGVMGGFYGEIDENTTNILIESAHFDQVTIARSARRHKLPSEASRRFERGVDTAIQPAAAQMAVDLLTEYGSGTASPVATDVDNTKSAAFIRFKVSEVKRLTALDVDVDKIAQILTDVGCIVAGGGNGELSVQAPTWRPDLTTPADLVEEIARLVGYDEIPIHVPNAPVKLEADKVDIADRLSRKRKRNVADTLASMGLVQVLSYPFVGKEDFADFLLDEASQEAASVEIANPLAADRPYLRTDVLLTLAQTVARNIRRGNQDVSLFEIGDVFCAKEDSVSIPALPGAVRPTDEQLAALDAGLPTEHLHVAAILTGNAIDSGWMKETRKVDWTDALAAVAKISDRLGAGLRTVEPTGMTNLTSWHPGRVAQVVFNDGEQDIVIGYAGELHPAVNEKLGFEPHSAALELDLSVLLDALRLTPLQAKPISTFPPVHQDFAFTVDESVASATVRDAIVQAAGPVLESIKLFDVFSGEQMEKGKKSLAFSVTFRAAEQTLTSDQTDAIRAAIVEKVTSIGGVLRTA
jgi:phenylalanyl-tRNA synthetase beta chain